MKVYLAAILIFRFAFLINFVNAQQPIFQNYTVNDGLVSNEVRQIFQDSKGFLWFGTLEGISKYDGSTFTNFSELQGLSHNFVNDFYESDNGIIYAALNDGNIDEIKDNKVIQGRSRHVTVNRFFKTPWNQVLALTDSNGFQDFSNGRLTRCLPRGNTNPCYFSAVVLSDTTFATIDLTSVQVYDKSFKLISTTRIQISGFETRSFKDSKGRIWVLPVYPVKFIKRIPGSDKIVLNPTLPPDLRFLSGYRVNDIFEDDEKNMWFATTTGIVKVRPDGFHQIFTIHDGLPSNIVNCIFSDREKNLWFATVGGLAKLATRSGISLYPIKNGVFAEKDVVLMYPYKKGHFLVGTFYGTKDFDKATGRFLPLFTGTDANFYRVIPNSNPLLLTGVKKSAMIDTSSLKAHIIPGFSGAHKFRIAVCDRAGNKFATKYDGLFFVSGKGMKKIIRYRIQCLLIDRNNNLWLGTWQNGLFRIGYKVVHNEIHILSSEHLLKNQFVRSLFEDTKGNIWVGSRYTGVYRLTGKSNGRFDILHLSSRDGLTSNFIKAIREDKKGNFWIGFFQGLDKLTPFNQGFQIFNFSRATNFFTGLRGMEVDSDNLIWLATEDGIVRIKDFELEKSAPPPVYITKIYSSDSIYGHGSEKLRFNYRQKDIEFNYSSPGFINEKQILYSYRLMGNSNLEWTAPSNHHTVFFAGLAPGNYEFQVRSLGWNRAWGKPAIVNFVITPPFWLSWWFIGLMALFVATIIYVFVKWRIKDVRTVASEKLKSEQLIAEQYKNELELEQVINYFSTSLIDKNSIDNVLGDVAKNLIAQLGFTDCRIYLWNDDKTKMIQKVGFGSDRFIEERDKQHSDVLPGQGVVGHVMQTREPLMVADTSEDPKFRTDGINRLSEIAVPIIYDNELIGVLDSEHLRKNFFTSRHLQIMSTIAALIANKIKSFEAEQSILQSRLEIYNIQEQLSKARLEAIRSQMNPHFIFNCINSIDALIQSNDKYYATVYLNKFAKLLRNILDSSKKDTVTISKDLETLQLYIELEKFRHENKFTAAIEAEEDLLEDDFPVPPLIVQPFVENAILHGLRYRADNQGKLDIRVNRRLNYIQYTIVDNGVGRNGNNRKLQEDKVSYGINMTCERVRLFNHEEKASVEIIDLFESGKPSGTRVELSLKIDA